MLQKKKSPYVANRVPAVPPETPALVKRPLKKIKAVYEPLPVVLDPEETMKPEAPTLHEDMPLPKNLPADVKVKNVCSYTPVHAGEPDKAMAEADVIVDEVYETKMIHPQYLEPRIAAARVEPDGRITVWANAQAPFAVGTDVARPIGEAVNKRR